MCHQEDRIDVPSTTLIVFHGGHHFCSNPLARVSPGVQYLVISFHVGNDAAFVKLAEFEYGFFRLCQNFFLVVGRHQIIGGKR